MSAFLSRVLQLSLCVVIIGACAPDGVELAGTASGQLLSGPLTVSPAGGFGDPGTSATIDAAGNVNWVGGAWYVPLALQAGDVIGSVSVVVRDNGYYNGHTLDGNNVGALLVSRTASGDTTRGYASSVGSGLQQTLSISMINGSYAVQAGDEMLLETVGLKGGSIPGQSTVSSMTGVIQVIPTPFHLTLQIPIVAPGGTFPNTVTFSPSTGGHYSSPISLTVGSTITAVRISGFAGTGTRLIAGLREADAIGNNFVVGAGAEIAPTSMQTIASATMSERVISGINYACEALITAGTASASIHSCEVDYVPTIAQ